MKAAIAIVLIAVSAPVRSDSFDQASNQLTIESVTVGRRIYSNVVLRLEKYSVVSVGTDQPVPVCEKRVLTDTLLDQINPSMNLTAVEDLLGCRHDSDGISQGSMETWYTWHWTDPVTMTQYAIGIAFDTVSGLFIRYINNSPDALRS
jgi:hypothetical protein